MFHVRPARFGGNHARRRVGFAEILNEETGGALNSPPPV
jgi:hypothetical protein